MVCFSASAQLNDQQQIQKLNYAYQQIRNNYVDDVPLEPLVEEAIKATIQRLDPHSTYLDREDMEALRARLDGEFAGIGLRSITHNDTLVVCGTIDSSPAHRADLRPNDRIVAIDGKRIIGIHQDSIASLLKSEAKSNVTLSIIRHSNDKRLDIKLQREIIETSAITSTFRIDNIGYIAISAFSKSLTSEFYEAYNSLGDITSLIIDLRDNAGGSITSAIDLSSLFLHKDDIIVSTEGRNRKIVYTKRRDTKPIATPLVVLINENSASASELFAGAMQDHDRGVIVGHTSFGKGLVQSVIDLKDGTGITLTTARYKTPSGRIIQRPYNMGGHDDYQRDSMRYMHPDSIPHDSKLLFHTLRHGRKIYGGGGITPDIYLPTDHILLSMCVARSYSEAQFEHSIIDYCDLVSPATIKKQHPSVERFDKYYTTDSTLLDIFYNRSGYTAEDITPLDREYIEVMLRATLAEHLYGSEARYYIYGRGFDPMLQQTIAIAGNHRLIASTLGFSL